MLPYPICRTNPTVAVLTTITAIAALFCSPAYANYPLKVCATEDLCGQVRAIDDAQMAAVAGKFTIAGEVVGLNLMMSSSWQAPNGQNLEGRLTLSVGLPNSGSAHIQYGTQASGTEAQETAATVAAPSVGTVGGGVGLQRVGGVSQLIQVAGDSNGASNRSSIELTTNNLSGIAGNSQLSASYKAANGAQAAVNIANNDAALRLTMPGAGLVQQQISGSSINQSIQIAADRQHVLNQLQLQVQMRPLTSAMQGAQGLSQSINMLRGR